MAEFAFVVSGVANCLLRKIHPLDGKDRVDRVVRRDKRVSSRRHIVNLGTGGTQAADDVASVAKAAVKVATAAAAAAVVVMSGVGLDRGIPAALAVSGGGKDYASQNHANETFHGDFTGKDFSGGLFRNCDFKGANLTSASLFKSELREANLSGANLSYATIEAAILRDTTFTDAVMVGSYISDSILEAGSIEGADFTDALISPASVIPKLCNRKDATGVNSATGASTRESLMCPD